MISGKSNPQALASRSLQAYDAAMAQDIAINEWLDALSTAVAEGGFVKLTLRKPTAVADDLKSVDVRPITIKRELKLSFTYHHQTRDVVKNYSPAESMLLLAELLAQRFTRAHLCTLVADLNLTKITDIGL